MERNAVAAFLLMLRNFLQGHAVNQESLVQCQGPAIIGALLRKVRPAGACCLPDRPPCLTKGTGWGTEKGNRMLSAQKGLLGEAALEWSLERLGRVWLRGSRGSASTRWDKGLHRRPGSWRLRREPPGVSSRQDVRVCLPVQGRVEAERLNSGRTGTDVSPQLLSPQVPSWAMDMNVLMSAQLLMEQVAAEGSGPLLYLLYQHLLFNFHLWTLSDFAVRLGRCEDLDEGTTPCRAVVEVLRSYPPAVEDLRGHHVLGRLGNMTLP